MPIFGEIIETDTIEAMSALEARKHVKGVTLLPNANLGSDGLLRGIVVEVEGGISPQLIGNHASRSYVAVKTELEGADSVINIDIAKMILSNIMPDNCRIVEIGVDECDCVWILSVMDGVELDVGCELKFIPDKDSRQVHYLSESSADWHSNWSFVENEVIPSLFGKYDSVDKVVTIPNSTYFNRHFRNVSRLSRATRHRGIILGSQTAGFAIVEGEGYYPTSCGTILNKELGRGIMDKQVRDHEFGDIETNANYFESPTKYRNLKNILDGMDNVKIVKHIKPILSVKNGDM